MLSRASRVRPRIRVPTRIPSRHSSTASPTPSSPLTSLRVLALSTSIALGLGVTYLYTTDTRASLHRYVVPPLLRLVFPDAEDAHHAGTVALRTLYALNLHPRERTSRGPDLSVSVFGTTLANPIGISAGLDKDADIPDPLFALGPAVVEVGGCTPLPQDGNPRPRLFRVPALEGLVNRYGLNSRGADAMAAHLRDRVRRFARANDLDEEDILAGRTSVNPGSLASDRLLLVQVAKNKDTGNTPSGIPDLDAVASDYEACTRRLAPYADVIVVNVSSPNTKGLRDLQQVEPLTRLLSRVVTEAHRAVHPNRTSHIKVMVKVSPDEDTPSQLQGIVHAVMESGIDGIIVGNTTKRKSTVVPAALPPLPPRQQSALEEEGGYSGPAMFPRTLALVQRYRRAFDTIAAEAPAGSQRAARKVIFATGGVQNGRQALEVINAGADVAMIYTAMVYGGAGTVTRIKGEMKESMPSK